MNAVPYVKLKGLKRYSKTTADGRRVVYWYAWEGGPRLPGEPGTPEFVAAYNAAVADRTATPAQTLAGLVGRYRASPEYAKLADATRKEWSRWLDRVGSDARRADIGGMSWRMLDDRRAKGPLLDWRDQWAATPRKADYAIQVLRRVLAFGVARGLLAYNAAEGVPQLYKSDRADQVWTEAEIARFVAAATTPEIGFIIRLACLTGLRRGDLARLSWSHVGPSAIVMPTGKSRGRVNQIIPLIAETRQLLAEIRTLQQARHAAIQARAAAKGYPEPATPATVLSTQRGQPFTVHWIAHAVVDTKNKCGISKHLHDARGTFATRLRRAGLTAPEIADVLGWRETQVERLLATYVDQDAIVLALAKRIEVAGTKHGHRPEKIRRK